MKDALNLIAEAEAALRDRIAPAAVGDARYHALLAANALATARRALSLLPAPTPSADVAAIRAGAHDGDAALYAALLADARRRAWVSDPSALAASDRALIEGALHG
jgi:hypothetical protein